MVCNPIFHRFLRDRKSCALTLVFFLCDNIISFDPYRQKIVKNYGVIECDPLVLTGLDKTVS